MTIEVVTFGCRLNGVESDRMLDLATAAGLGEVAVVNSCAVTAEAGKQARQAVRRLKRERPDRPVVVTGCAAQVDPTLFAAMPEVAAVLGNDEKTRPETWRGLADLAGAPSVQVGDIMAVGDAAPYPAPRASQVRASVQVQTGCDHRCTFCIIPFGRGRSRSTALDTVLRDVRSLVESGAREVVLTGVDLTDYGRGLAHGLTLGRLVKTILRTVRDLPRLRLSSLDCVEADPDLLDALATEPRLMPHLHLSLQAGDDLVLKRMKRRHGRDDAIRFCDRIRVLRPDIVFGADLIAGFPTETEPMFARSLDIVAECGLAHLHVFPFSARPGTPAARMPAVPGEVVRERARRLREAGAAALGRYLDGEVGQKRRVLVENGTLGRTEGFAAVRFSAPRLAGEIVDPLITDHDGRELTAD